MHKYITLKNTKHLALGIFRVGVYAFAAAGFLFIAAYIGVNLHLTNTKGILDQQAEGFWNSAKDTSGSMANSTSDTFFTAQNYCALRSLKDTYPGTFLRILTLALGDKEALAQNNLTVAMETAHPTELCADLLGKTIEKKDFEALGSVADTKTLFIFGDSSEWDFFKLAVTKDKSDIQKAGALTGIKSRTLVAMLVAEQMRLFYSDRAWFESAIAPVKVLASMSQFSLGVLGVKQETAEQIEANLKDPNSPFYPGPEFEHTLDFTTGDPAAERFQRLTDYHNHYYDYLYEALYCKEVIAQWQKAGIDISNRPEILATLYNIGFAHSVPKENPQTGGAEIDAAGQKYSFGKIAYYFYYSGELVDEFPQQ